MKRCDWHKSDDFEKRRAFAARLGIDPSSESSDPLTELLFEPNELSEDRLEQLFGLSDTRRNPLSVQLVLGDEQKQITRCSISGVEWQRNTSVNGSIYLTLVRADGDYGVQLYRDQERAFLVASGSSSTENGRISLVEANDSGLAGFVEINYLEDSESIEIAAVPRFLSWQLRHLRTVWFEQDWPADDFARDVAPGRPLIDPDVIGPDDFRKPDASDSAFEIWLNRRHWLDAQIATMKTLKTDFNGVEVPDIQAMLERLTIAVTYDEAIEGGTVVPWEGVVVPIDLLEVLSTITEDADEETIEQVKENLQASFHLTIEGLSRLLEIREKG